MLDAGILLQHSAELGSLSYKTSKPVFVQYIVFLQFLWKYFQQTMLSCFFGNNFYQTPLNLFIVFFYKTTEIGLKCAFVEDDTQPPKTTSTRMRQNGYGALYFGSTHVILIFTNVLNPLVISYKKYIYRKLLYAFHQSLIHSSIHCIFSTFFISKRV